MMRTMIGTAWLALALALLSESAADAQRPLDQPAQRVEPITAPLSVPVLPKPKVAPLAVTCANAQFKGVYGAIAKGEFNLPALGPLNGPTTRIGRVQVDGKGNSEISAITSLNGIVLKESYEGEYTIYPDCTAKVVLLIPFPGVGFIPFEFSGVVSDNFHQMDIQLVNPQGTTVGLTLRRQGDETNCSARDLDGGYAIDLRGQTNLLTPPSTPFYRLGRVVFDGNRSFTAQTHTSTAGVIAAENFAGSYEVDRNCFFTMKFGSEEWTGLIRDNSTNAVVIVSGPVLTTIDPIVLGVVIAGTLTKQ